MEDLTRELSNVAERSTRKRRRPFATRSSSTATRVGIRSYPLLGAQLLFGLHLIVAPLLLGGVYAWGMVAIACSALTCLLATAIARSDLRVDAPAVIWVAQLLLGWTALQAVLLPCGLVSGVASGAAEVLTEARAALGWSAPTWCSLSYDPGATRQEAVKGVALVATLLTAWILSAGSSRREVLWMAAASSLAMSSVALAHAIVGADAVFGVYRPVEFRSGLLLAPLLNANNLGAFAALGAPLWITLTYRHQRPEVRWWGRIATLVTTLAAVLTLSRGAIAQALGTLVFIAGYIYVRSRRSRKASGPPIATAALGVVGTAAVALALVAYVAGRQVAAEFAGGNLSKLALLGRTFAFAAEHPWVGVGRGAFASAFLPATQTGVRFGHAENFVAQWASEWGIPVTLVWCSALLLALWRRVRAAKTLATIGAATALLGLCAQNLVDLGFEILGVATIAIALLGAILSPNELRSQSVALPGGSLRASVAVTLFAGFTLLLALGPRLQADSVSALDESLRASLQAGQRDTFRSTLQHAVALHPAEPLFPILAATEGLRHDDRRTPRWLNHAMQLAPDWGAPHVLTFQWLWRWGHREQALLELKLAAERDSHWALVGHLCQLARLEGELVLSAVPRGKQRRPVLEVVSNCVSPESRTSELVDELLLRDDPTHAAALERNAFRVARSGDVEVALSMFAQLLRAHPDRASARVTRAGMLQLAERYDELVRQIDRDLPLVPEPERLRLLNIQADAYARLRDLEGVRRSVGAYRSEVGTSVDGLANSYALDGSMQMRLENFGAALSAFHEAYRINGATQHLLAIAGAANSLGNRGQLIWAHIRLCEREPVGTSYCAERDRLLAAPGK